MIFPFGRAVLAMAGIAVVAGALVAMRTSRPRGDVVLWLPSPSHHAIYAPLLTGWRTSGGSTVAMEQINERALNVRLLSMFMGGRADPGVPDVVQIEIGSVGKFLRPPVDGIGLLPLDRYLDGRGERTVASAADPGQAGWRARLVDPVAGDGADDGATVLRHDGVGWRPAEPGARADHWRERILASRLAPWQKGGATFGLPIDLHPVTLTWRADLWREVGVDPEAAVTWADFHEACLRFEDAWRERGTDRAAIGVTVTPAQVVARLLQQGVNPGDERGFHLSDARVVGTLCAYARMIAGPRRVGASEAAKTTDVAAQLARGDIAACVTPDWRVGILLSSAPELAGRLRMRALPVPAIGDAPTTTIGGTMIGITRVCPDPDAAWEVIERVLLDPAAFAARLAAKSAIMMPLPERWTDPVYRAAHPGFAGQAIGELYTSLAPLVPARHAGPASGLAGAAIGIVLARACARLEAGDDAGLEPAVAAWLAEQQVEAERALAHGSFE